MALGTAQVERERMISFVSQGNTPRDMQESDSLQSQKQLQLRPHHTNQIPVSAESSMSQPLPCSIAFLDLKWRTGRICGSRRGPRLRGRREADPEGMAACGQSLEGFAQMQCSQASGERCCANREVLMRYHMPPTQKRSVPAWTSYAQSTGRPP